MSYYPIPICFFPTSTLFVDDSPDFLSNFVLQLDDTLTYKLFNSPFAALKDLNNKSTDLAFWAQRCLSEYTETKNCPLTNHTVNLNLAAIHTQVYNPARFSEISVVVVDYGMPQMNGLEFCRGIKNAKLKKILLTGKADEKLAIDAFNEGLIDRFVSKSDPHAAGL